MDAVHLDKDSPWRRKESKQGGSPTAGQLFARQKVALENLLWGKVGKREKVESD